jgi:hypothetical protein
METMQISLNEYEKLKDKGIAVTDIYNQKYLIIGNIAFIAVVGIEDNNTQALKDYESQHGNEEETIY